MTGARGRTPRVFAWRAATFLVGAAAMAGVAPGAGAQAIGTLAFTSQEARGVSAIYTVKTDGTGRVRLGEGSAPAWSPDRTQIAFVFDTLENLDVWVMRADGNDRRRLTDDPGADIDPAWSPDGRTIAFASDRARTLDLYIMNADGTDERPLTNNPDNETAPAWSPDGRRLAFTAQNTDGSSVFTMAVDGSDRRQLTSTTTDHTPAWSPDGTSVAFVSGRASTGDLYVMRAAGGREARLTSLGNADDPSWSPDAAQLAFGVTTAAASSSVLAQASTASAIYVMNSDGTSQAKINSETADSDPAWQPASPAAADGTGEGPLVTPAPDVDTSVDAAEEEAAEQPAGSDSEVTDQERDRRGGRAGRAETDANRANVSAQGLTPNTEEDAERSTFPASLIEPADVRLDPAALLVSALLAALIPLLIFPAILFNNTLEENYDEVRSWFRRRPTQPETHPAGSRAHLLRFVPLALAAALAAVFLDPDLDLDRASLALFIGIIGAFVIATVVDFAPVLYLRRRRAEPGVLRTYGGAIAVVVICVALSRAVGFEPGYLYGTVAGFAMASTITGPARGWAQTISIGALLSWALISWALWIPVGRAAESSDPSLVILVLDALLAASFVAGVETSMFALIPARFLEGRDIFEHSRVVWLILSGAAAFAFVHVLLAPSVGYGGSVGVMLALFGIFGGISVAFWAYFRFRTERPAGEVAATRGGETVGAD